MLKKISVSLLAILLGFGLTFGAIYAWRNSGGANAETAAKKPELLNSIGEKLPPSNLTTSSGENFDDAELRTGKVLIIFLSSDCAACGLEIQQLAEIYPAASSQIRFYGISVDPAEKRNALAENKNINFPVAFDENREFAKSLAVKGVPTKFLVVDGIVKKVFQGKFPDSAEARRKLELP